MAASEDPGSPGADPGIAGFSPLLQVELVDAVREPMRRDRETASGLQLARAVVNRELVDTPAPGARSKRHIEIALPEGVTYRAGGYLTVLPLNPAGVVDRALARFALSFDARAIMRIDKGGHTFARRSADERGAELGVSPGRRGA